MRYGLLWILGLSVTTALGVPAAYDPLLPIDAVGTPHDVSVVDPERDRVIPLRIVLPQAEGPAAVILFSHGLGGSRFNNDYLARHWTARGYAVVFLQHPGSDEAIWRNVPLWRRMAVMRSAANAGNFLARALDVSAVLDQLEQWNGDLASAFHERLDLSRIGMSGHSFGAVTTQAVAGQSFGRRERQPFTDERIIAALMFSPSSPRDGTDPAVAFGEVSVPWMLMTGTHDTAPIGGADVASRLKVFPALPEGRKYELVLDGAEHSAFSERPLPGDRRPRNPAHQRAILALSTAFWDACLNGDGAAAAWLDSDQPLQVLDPADRWQTK